MYLTIASFFVTLSLKRKKIEILWMKLINLLQEILTFCLKSIYKVRSLYFSCEVTEKFII